MSYELETTATEAVTLAVTTVDAHPAEVPSRISSLLAPVNEWLQTSGVERTGPAYALYWFVSGGMKIQVGFPVSSRFESSGSVESAALPAGKAAHTVHRGDAGSVIQAHAQLHRWCAQQSHRMGELAWEVFGDQPGDPTHVYIQIA